ncbi:prepilin peptidase [Mycolicibacterium anyangense]|jgi:leader peptidase (prepilin peptidase)/N-methyltransferase|uniref:Prepilin peptidase n=1 Tax=Mycolicibacterium anyangense TaxID=1431246 RepID=A0A6N4W186_9MYCO|nr:A24 family peptidase [Mycolicibacterium anyangense]BBZ75640.1 prepilin peptidase [Mycolicibacterium anyangense]
MRWVGCAVILGWAIALSGYDIRQRRLPNVLTLPGAAVVLIGATAAGRGLPAAYGAVGLALLYLIVHLVSPGGMGAGDVKLALGLGALTGAFGPAVWLLAAVAAPLLTALCGIAGRIRTVPHGPSMCIASLTAVALVVF